jgi:hypothetical protein
MDFNFDVLRRREIFVGHNNNKNINNNNNNINNNNNDLQC